MGLQLPPNAPKSTSEAFAYVDKLRNGATIDDLKILALVEAIGKELYDDLARRADHPQVKALLEENGREELRHAHRVSQAIEILTGQPFPIPPIEENPIYSPLDPMPLTKVALSKLAAAELAGDDLYEGIAASFDNPDAVALFKQNGREEIEHGHRLVAAAELLPE